jgi:hypothetical protein
VEKPYIPSATHAKESLIHYEYRLYASIAAGVLYRDYAAQRCYEETITIFSLCINLKPEAVADGL